MALKRMVMELGLGTDISGQDYTKAACRAVHNALRQNSLSVADAFGLDRDAMQVEIIIGVADPDQVDEKAVAAMIPYGNPAVRIEKGGMNTTRADGSPGPVAANAALIVSLDLPEGEAA